MGTRLAFCTAAAAIIAMAAAGCALKTPPERAELWKDALPNLQTPAQWKAGGAAGRVADGWLASFGESRLDALVREALAHNPDLRVAAARVEQAAGYVKVAGGALYPSVSVLARVGGKMSGDSSGLQGVGITAGWELDLWGRVRYGRAAAEQQYASTDADAEYAVQSLAALVAKSWFLATEALLQREVAGQTVRASEELLRVAETRRRVGIGGEQDVALARASRDSYRDSLRQIEFAYTQSVRALEALLGRYPAAGLDVPSKLAALPGPAPAGLPVELLERRPDVIAADRRVAAAFYRVGEAEAARLPTISLTASLTSISSELFVLQPRNNPVVSLGAGLFWPIFTGGALQAQVEIRTAEQKQAVAEYGRVALRAVNEAEGTLAAEVTLAERVRILREGVTENERALELARIQYRVGKADLRVVEQQLLRLYAARVALLRVQSEQLVQRVNLHLALGGGWVDEASKGVVKNESTK